MTWKRLFFALVTVVLFFAVIEGVLWALGARTLLEERDPYQGFSDQVGVFELDRDRGVYRSRRRAVLHSFNYQEFASEKPAAGYRIFVLGGSTAAGFPWGADVAFTRALGDSLQAAWPERDVEAVNVAAMSYGSHRLRILTRELLNYDPDALVLFTGHNEFVERLFYREMLESPGALDGLRRPLFHSRIYASVTRLYEAGLRNEAPVAPDVGEVSTGELLGLDVAREYAIDITDADRAEAAIRFEENIRAIVEQAHQAEVTVVLCTVPSNILAWLPNQSFFSAEIGLEAQRSALDLLNRAKADLERQAPEQAADALVSAIALAPGYAELHFRLGQAFAALGRWDEARREFVRARDTDGKPSRAPSPIIQAIRRVASDTGAILVDVDLRFEQLSEHGIPGFDLFEDYVHLKPRGHRHVALELWRKFQSADLVGSSGSTDTELFRRAVGDPDEGGIVDVPEAALGAGTPQMLFNLAVVLENQGLLDEAIPKYLACLELDPGYYVARYNVARLLAKTGDLEGALEHHRKTLEQKPDFDKAWIGTGEVLRSLGRSGEAELALRRATEANPRSAHAWSSLGAVLVDRNRQGEAEAAFRVAVQLDPRNVDNRVNLGLSLLFQTRLDEADEAFHASLELRPHHRPASNGLAAVLTERGRLSEAEEIFRESLRLDPGDTFARGGLAVVEERRAASP
jgi:tetratricopeptide (TPR) repeat protein